MRYVRAACVGVIGAVAAPFVLAVVFVVLGVVLGVFGGIAATGGGGIAGVAIPFPDVMLIALSSLVGFVLGFLWSLRARTTAEP